MRIRVEPKEFFMYSVFLSFNVENPDSEDEAVRSYLDEHDLEPKMRGTDTLEGQDFEVQYFGGCYLGRHLQVIGDMQRTTVEKEMLAGEIEATLRAATDSPVRKALANLAEPELKEILAGLVREFYRGSSFGPDEEGYLKVTLVPAMTEQRFMEMSSNRV